MEEKQTLYRQTIMRKASETFFLADWAKGHGIACPEAEQDRFVQNWESKQQVNDRQGFLDTFVMTEKSYLSVLRDWALSEWIVGKSPYYFGYISWSMEEATIKELQITGKAALMAESLDGEPSR